MIDSARMSRRGDTRSPYTAVLVAVLVLLVVVLVVFAVLAWSREGVSCSGGGSPATVTVPPTAEPAATTSTQPPTTQAPTTSTTAAPVAPLDFDGSAAMRHIQALAEDIGPRKSGTQAEDDALGYATAYLQSLGYDVQTLEVALPEGLASRDLTVTKKGASDSLIVIGGHIDTKAGAPGGNDNASGVAVVLELARDFRDADTAATLQFVVFGAEEMTDSNADHHHYGSRQFVQGMTEAERAALVGMVSVDMVGYGTEFNVRTMNEGPQILSDLVRAYANDTGLSTGYLKDTGKYGWSDHEPFELAGYPAVWLEWRDDPTYHTSRDTYAHCDPDDVQRVGTMLAGFLARLTQADLDTLAEARTP
jgi:aminopeptidase YwaD